MNAPAGIPSLTALIENVPGNVYRRVRRIDGTYHFEYLSSGLFRHFGIDNERLLRQPTITFDWIHPDDRERFAADLELSAAMLSVLDHRVRVVGQDGRVHWARGIARPERRPDGSTVWDGIVIDVTREIESESALRIAKDDAERAQTLVTRIITDIAARIQTPLDDLNAMLETFDRSMLGAGLHDEIARIRSILHDAMLPLLAAPNVTETDGPEKTARGPSQGVSSLTPRQRHVLRLVAESHSNKVIADQLGISPGTVKLHVAAVLKAMGATSRKELVQRQR
jgi:PAS domain S-box-containing protein